MSMQGTTGKWGLLTQNDFSGVAENGLFSTLKRSFPNSLGTLTSVNEEPLGNYSIWRS